MDRVPVEFKKEMAKKPQDLTAPLTSIFTKLDNELRLIDSDGCGSTACVCVIRKEGNQSVLYVANVGDTRCVMGKNMGKEAQRMSIDDKCDNAEEVARIKSTGGIVID